jgi:hypothetical protein
MLGADPTMTGLQQPPNAAPAQPATEAAGGGLYGGGGGDAGRRWF